MIDLLLLAIFLCSMLSVVFSFCCMLSVIAIEESIRDDVRRLSVNLQLDSGTDFRRMKEFIESKGGKRK